MNTKRKLEGIVAGPEAKALSTNGKALSADEVYELERATTEAIEAGVYNARPQDRERRRPKFRSFKHETVEAWMLRDCPPDHAPEYPLNAAIFDMSIGKPATRHVLTLLHAVLAEAYRSKSRKVTFSKKALTTYLATTSARVRAAAKSLEGLQASLSGYRVFNGSKPYSTALIDSIEDERSTITFIVNAAVYADLSTPKLYVHVNLSNIRSLKTVYGVSLYPYTAFISRKRPAVLLGLLVGYEHVEKATRLRDFSNACKAPGEHLKTSHLVDRLEKAFEDISKNSTACRVYLKETFKTDGELHARLHITPGRRDPLYTKLPKNASMKLFNLKTSQDLYVNPRRFVRLVAGLGLKCDMTTGLLVQQSWKLHIFRAANAGLKPSSKMFYDFEAAVAALGTLPAGFADAEEVREADAFFEEISSEFSRETKIEIKGASKTAHRAPLRVVAGADYQKGLKGLPASSQSVSEPSLTVSDLYKDIMANIKAAMSKFKVSAYEVQVNDIDIEDSFDIVDDDDDDVEGYTFNPDDEDDDNDVPSFLS